MEQEERGRRAVTFDRVAALYDAVRPGYPDALVEHVLAFAGLGAPGRILEVGCGPAKATLPFARRGHRMLCLEPGAALAAIAREHLAPYPDAEVHEARFEDFPLSDAPFDLVMSAQAWHWVDPEVGDAKAARALRPGGAVALFWNRPIEIESPLRSALDDVYRAHAPHLMRTIAPGGGQATTGEPLDERIARAGAFAPAEIHRFPWQEVYETRRYLELMETQSNHQLLPEAPRERLLEGLGRAIDAAGGRIAVDYDAVLILARRLPQPDAASAPAGGA